MTSTHRVVAQSPQNTAPIGERLAFMGFAAQDRSALRRIQPIIAKAIHGALDRFYAQVRKTPQTARFFSGEPQIAGAKRAQAEHWDAIASGEFSADYARRIHRIGTMHARIGLEPRWYLGGYAMVADDLIRAVMGARFQSKKQTTDNVVALVKALLLDVELSVSAYQEVSDAEVIDKIGTGLERLAEGDLTHRVAGVTARFAKLQADFNTAASTLGASLATVAEAAGAVDICADELRAASQDLGRRTEAQAASLEETSATMQGITAATRITAESSANVYESMGETVRQVEQGQQIVGRTVGAIEAIAHSSKEITSIIDLIESIAFQTNLLALNASIEAARAGASGKGFTVVANEVRLLAQRSSEAAQSIKGIIAQSTSQVSSGVALVGETGAQLGAIAARVGTIDTYIAEISGSSQEQAGHLDNIAQVIADMDRMTQQNAAMVEQASASATQLAARAAELAGQVARFQLGTSKTGVSTLRRVA